MRMVGPFGPFRVSLQPLFGALTWRVSCARDRGVKYFPLLLSRPLGFAIRYSLPISQEFSHADSAAAADTRAPVE